MRERERERERECVCVREREGECLERANSFFATSSTRRVGGSNLFEAIIDYTASMITDEGGCCSTRIEVSLTHCTFLFKIQGQPLQSKFGTHKTVKRIRHRKDSQGQIFVWA